MTIPPVSRRAGTVKETAGAPSCPAISEERSSGAGPATTTPGQDERATSDPRQSELVLGALRSAVPCARKHTRQMLWEWDKTPLADAAELVVSELVTNAVLASEALRDSRPDTPVVQLWLSAKDERVLIQVWDSSEQMPQRRKQDPEADGGRGLSIVTAFSQSCGSYELEDGAGKIVWAIVGPNSPEP
jgi:anti-sigma regulatory factor (Ser/Thr protein kinase)